MRKLLKEVLNRLQVYRNGYFMAIVLDSGHTATSQTEIYFKEDV